MSKRLATVLLLLTSGCATIFAGDIKTNLHNAQVYRQQRNYKRALECYDSVLSYDGDNLEARKGRAELLFATGDLPRAVAESREVVRRNPRYPNALRDLGDLLMDAKDYNAAFDAYSQLAAASPTEAMPLNSEANAVLKKGEVDKAISLYREATKRTHNREDDLEDYQKRNRLVGCNPDVAFPYTNLGWALIAKGDDDGALAAFREATRPTGPAEAYFGMGTVLEKRGDLDGALKQYREAGSTSAIRRCGADFGMPKTSYCLQHGFAGTPMTHADATVAEARVLHLMGKHGDAKAKWEGVVRILKQENRRDGDPLPQVTLADARASYDAEKAHVADEERARQERRAREDAERRERSAQADAARQAERQREEAAGRQRAAQIEALARKHGASRLDWQQAGALVANPFPYRGKNVLLQLVYVKNIAPDEAILQVYPLQEVVQLDSARNFAGRYGVVQCIARVVGLVTVRQGVGTRDIPHLKEVTCVGD